MKYIIIFLTILFSISIVAQNQSGRKRGKFHKKFIELEKIKLLESLDLDEETSAKFITRRNKSRDIQREKIDKIKKAYLELESAIEDQESESKLLELITKINTMETNLFNEKNSFIQSLADILNTEQIAKVVIFEQKFKRDIRDLLLERGRKKYLKKNPDSD